MMGRLALAGLPAAMLAVLLLRPSTNSDLYWQVKLGELMIDRGELILREPFAALHLDEPASTVAWAGHIVMALAYRCAGWEGLRLFDALCWCGGFWAAAAACRARGASPGAVAAALALGFVAALPTAVVRPQNFAVLGFGLLVGLLRLELRPAATVLLAAPLLLVWQNLHPSVGAAAGVLGLSAAAGWIGCWRDRTRRRPLAETVLTPIALLSTFCTPEGLAVLDTSARNADVSVLLRVSEWLPLWDPINHLVAVPIVIAAGLGAYIVWLRRDRIDIQEFAVALALLVMTILVYRFVLFWAIASIPLIARAGGPAPSRIAVVRPPPPWLGWSATLGVVGAATVLWLAPPRPFIAHPAMPAILRLADENRTGTVFADSTLGGPLIHVGHPQWRVAYDGRFYRYTEQEWRRFAAIQSGALGLDEVVAIYRPTAFVLRRGRNARLIDAIAARSGEWRRIWADRYVVVYVPAASLR